MRFIWNFFFFGILFYLIWMFFPDAFMTLVDWANHVVAFFRDLFTGLWSRIQHRGPEEPTAPTKALILLPLLGLWRKV